MAAGGETMTSLDLALKNVYAPKLQNFLGKVKNSLLAEFSKTTRTLEGRKMIVGIKTGENQGMADGGETDALPVAGNMTWANAEFFPREHSGALQVTQAAIERAKATGGSFITALTESMKDLMIAVRREMEMQVHGRGTGELAYLSGANDSTTITLLVGNQGPEADHLMQDGAKVDLVDIHDYTTLVATGVTVSARTATGCTLSAAPSGSHAGDIFIRSGSKSKAMQGIRSVVNTANPSMPAGEYYGNLNRTTAANVRWQGMMANGATLSVAKIDAAVDLHGQYCDDDVSEIRTSDPVVRKIAGISLPSLLHYYPKDMKSLETTYTNVTYRDIRMVRDMFCWRGDLYFLDRSSFEIGQTGPIGWLGADEGPVLKWVSGYKQWVAYTYWNRELICFAPYRNLVLYNCLS